MHFTKVHGTHGHRLMPTGGRIRTGTIHLGHHNNKTNIDTLKKQLMEVTLSKPKHTRRIKF